MHRHEPPGADCHVRLGADLISHTWDGVVLSVLRAGPARRHELLGHIGGISDKALHESIRRLRDHGLVQPRDDGPGYRLTDLGLSFATGPLLTLARWAEEHRDDLAPEPARVP